MKNKDEKLCPFHQVVSDVLKSLVFSFKKDGKADFAFGGTVTILGVLSRAIIPTEHLPEVINACDFVNQALELLEEDEVADGLKETTENTLRNLRERLPK